MPPVGWIRPYLVNVPERHSILSAVGPVPTPGGAVYIPRGLYTPTSTTQFVAPLTLPYDRPIHLLGDGIDQSVLIYDALHGGTDHAADLLYVSGDGQTIEGLTL